MSLISLIIFLVVIGLILWLVSLLPIDDTIQRIIHIVVIIVVVLWLLQAFVGPIADIHIGR